MLGKHVGQADRPGDHRVVGVADTVGRVGMRKVGDAQQQMAHLRLHIVVLVGQHPLVVAQRAAARLQCLGLFGVAGLAQRADLLAELVDLGADGITPGDDVAGSLVETGHAVELLQQFGIAATGHGRADDVGLVAQQADVDHRSARLPLVTW